MTTRQCIACYMQTDTAISVAGSAEWLVWSLTSMDVPEIEAAATVKMVLKDWKEKPPARMDMFVCRRCAAKADFQVERAGLLLTCYVEPGMQLDSTYGVIRTPWSPPGDGKSRGR